MLRLSKNTSIDTTFGPNRPIETINVTIERSIVEHFENITAVGSSMEGPDDPVDKRYKNA